MREEASLSEDTRGRLERLEESHAFAERHAEQLSNQLIEAYERIEQLEKRLRDLERRLTALNEPDETGMPDPTGLMDA